MDRQFTACTGPSLEEVQQRFERWREGRKRGTPIPAALWEPYHPKDEGGLVDSFNYRLCA